MTSDGVNFLALNADKNHTATFALFVARRHTRGVSQHLCDLTGMSQARLVTPRTCCSSLVRYAGYRTECMSHVDRATWCAVTLVEYRNSLVRLYIVQQLLNILAICAVACALIC